MNKLIHQFNIKGDLWSFLPPHHLKNFYKESGKGIVSNSKFSQNNSRDWYIELREENHQLNDVELEKLKEIKSKHHLLTVWIFSNSLQSIKPEFIEIADFIVVQCSSEEISKIGKINLHNIPIGIPLVISKSFLENKNNIQKNNLFDILDGLLLIINSWKQVGVKDIFIDIDFSDSFNELNLFPLLKSLKILKYLNIPITARLSALDSPSYKVGLEILVESIFDLGVVLIRSKNSNKLPQLVSLRKKRFSLENG